MTAVVPARKLADALAEPKKKLVRLAAGKHPVLLAYAGRGREAVIVHTGVGWRRSHAVNDRTIRELVHLEVVELELEYGVIDYRGRQAGDALPDRRVRLTGFGLAVARELPPEPTPVTGHTPGTRGHGRGRPLSDRTPGTLRVRNASEVATTGAFRSLVRALAGRAVGTTVTSDTFARELTDAGVTGNQRGAVFQLACRRGYLHPTGTVVPGRNPSSRNSPIRQYTVTTAAHEAARRFDTLTT